MRYDQLCKACETIKEYSCPIELRDEQVCRDCGTQLERLFNVADVVLPERFTKWELKNLEPSYAECLAIDKRNEEYLRNKPSAPPKPDFEKILERECVERKVDYGAMRRWDGR
jgi:hypothetical protein